MAYHVYCFRWSCGLLGLLVLLGQSALLAAEVPPWQPVTVTDEGTAPGDSTKWHAYQGASLSTITREDTGRPAVRVQVAAATPGGLSMTLTPRGGFGNRVQVKFAYRLVSGAPLTIYAGPNTWNQAAVVLSSPQWETAGFEVGLLSDFPLVLHVVHPAGGVFELSDFTVAARGPERQVRRQLGPVDVAVAAEVPSAPGAALRLQGDPPPQVKRPTADQAPAPGAYHLVLAPHTLVNQSLGYLPAGAKLALHCRAKAAPGGPATLGLRMGGKALASAAVPATDWGDLVVSAALDQDGWPEWFAAAEGGAAELWLSGLRVEVTLPDPLGPGTVPLPAERRPIAFSVGDAKSIVVRPPWPGVNDVLCHLEYNSRWSFASPTSHEAVLSPAGNDLRVTWHFENDPVQYSLHWVADQPDAALVEVRLDNGGAVPVPAFSPGLCLQNPGIPRTFAYMVIPVQGKPLPLHLATPEVPPAEPWPGLGWIRVHYGGSTAYQERLRQGAAYQPQPHWVREVGDFPLLARRLPGRNAWIAWVWPTAVGYFGNTMAPCMHMDPVLPDAPAGGAARLFGRLFFFEGTWEELYARAQTELKDLQARAASLDK